MGQSSSIADTDDLPTDVLTGDCPLLVRKDIFYDRDLVSEDVKY